MNQNELPLPWDKALFAIIPGLFATAGLVNADFSAGMLFGLILLAALLIFAYLWNKRQLPAWSLMAVGMLTSIGLAIASGVMGGLAAILLGESANLFVLLLFLAALVILLRLSLRGQPVSLLTWVLFAVIVACQLAVRVKYFFIFGGSWSVAGQWLNISLYAVMVALLLPVAIGLRLAPRYRLSALLFVIGAIYVGFQLLIDVNYKVSGQIGGTPGFSVYKALIPLLFTVVAPLWFLRAQSLHSRVGGMLAVAGLAVILDLVVVGWAYGDLPLIIWISFIPYTLSVLLTLALAYLYFKE